MTIRERTALSFGRDGVRGQGREIRNSMFKGNG